MNRKEISIIMPIGINFGWGICGQYLAREMSRLCDVELVTEGFELKDVGDETAFKELKTLCVSLEKFNKNSDKMIFDRPVFQTIQGHNLKPWYVQVQSPRTIGYTFFEKDSICPEDINRAKGYYETIVAGSSWCENILREAGFPDTQTIIQGIDSNFFHPGNNEKLEYKDKFVVFSGGKLELRKGQDLVIGAFKVMQDKYPDVLLINLWYNQWTPTIETMKISPYIRFEMPRGNYFSAINHLLQVNGVDPQRVISLPPKPHNQMAEIYKNTDLGLFPNRCEGGTNLVLMEYMACGKPVIASYASGHKDVLSKENSIPISSLHPFNVQNQEGKMLYRWEEPSLDEIISALEWAYWHRDELDKIGRVAGEDLAKLTWEKSARQFFALVQ
jgi:glycosyltransferase involved in cell wall biosynthesis